MRSRGVQPRPEGPPSGWVLERQFEPSTASLPDGRQLELRACEEEGAAVGAVEPAELVLEVIAPTREEALDHAAPFLRRAVRELAFDLQQPLAIVRVEVAAPNEREPFVIYGFPLEPFGVGFRPWAPAVYAPTRRTRLRDYQEQSERVERALHWYVQALDTRLLLDRFLSLWIALQALAASAEKVVAPELLRCRHFVRFCPECGAATDQPRSAPASASIWFASEAFQRTRLETRGGCARCSTGEASI